MKRQTNSEIKKYPPVLPTGEVQKYSRQCGQGFK